jgi:predicted  nucleic acid-binding Zn-ribbon protein
VSEDRTKELPGATPFENRVLAELGALRKGEQRLLAEVAAIRGEVKDLRGEVTELRVQVTEIRTQQVAMAKNIAALDQRLTSLEEKVDSRLKETRPIWEAVRAQIEKLDEKFNLFIRDLYDIRYLTPR